MKKLLLFILILSCRDLEAQRWKWGFQYKVDLPGSYSYHLIRHDTTGKRSPSDSIKITLFDSKTAVALKGGTLIYTTGNKDTISKKFDKNSPLILWLPKGDFPVNIYLAGYREYPIFLLKDEPFEIEEITTYLGKIHKGKKLVINSRRLLYNNEISEMLALVDNDNGLKEYPLIKSKTCSVYFENW